VFSQKLEPCGQDGQSSGSFSFLASFSLNHRPLAGMLLSLSFAETPQFPAAAFLEFLL
jgi:hypothetical protein